MLESIRSSLYTGNDSAEAAANASLNATDPQATKLASVADKFERTALNILKDSPSERVNATVQRALGLINNARLDIGKGDFAGARSDLSDAFSALNEAKEMLRNNEDSKESQPRDDSSAEHDGKDSDDKDSEEEGSSGSDGKGDDNSRTADSDESDQ
jgi:hypothetical protein